LTYQIRDDGDQDGPQNATFIQTPDTTDSPKKTSSNLVTAKASNHTYVLGVASIPNFG